MTLRLLVPMVLILVPHIAAAQTYSEIRAAYPGAETTTVTSNFAYVYGEPDLSADVVGRYGQGRELLAYNKLGDFYAVATPANGHVGYVLLTTLDVPQDPGAAAQPDMTKYIDPGTARMMSLAFPGAGHLYADQTATGGFLMGLSLASFVGGYFLTEESREVSCDDVLTCEEEVDYTYVLAGSAVTLGAWLFGIYDAPRAARRANRQAGVTAALQLTRDPIDHRPVPGLALRYRW